MDLSVPSAVQKEILGANQPDHSVELIYGDAFFTFFAKLVVDLTYNLLHFFRKNDFFVVFVIFF
jgi:hypothetical protein